ncbi:MAG: MFS transporter, partial [Gammaproteobacteria bacterium]
ALSKPIFPLSPGVGWIFTGRLLDRIGKGIRGAPRDALIADVTPLELRGSAYGLRQSLDSVGAFIGPLLAIALLVVFANDIRLVLWFAVIPAVLSVLILVVAVTEVATPSADRKALAWRAVTRLRAHYWWVVSLGVVFTLARFSEAFLIIHGQNLGLGLTFAPLVLIVLGITYALSAYPAGFISDRISARSLLLAGLACLTIADCVLAAAAAPGMVLLGAGLWGVHLGLTQGLLNKLVADTAPVKLRGTAFGIFNLASGLALLSASVIAGLLWDRVGPAATFVVGAGFAAVAMLGVVVTATKPAS